MDKQIHFYDNFHSIPEDTFYGVTWENLEKDITLDKNIIHTTQMGALILSDKLFQKGYRIFIHDKYGMFEITYGNCARTNREIRPGHNIFKMWMAGEFTNYEKEN